MSLVTGTHDCDCPPVPLKSSDILALSIDRLIDRSIDRSITIMSICIAPNKQKSSEVLAAKQMRFELFCEYVNGKRRSLQFNRKSIPCRWPRHRQVMPADGGHCHWHNDRCAMRPTGWLHNTFSYSDTEQQCPRLHR